MLLPYIVKYALLRISVNKSWITTTITKQYKTKKQLVNNNNYNIKINLQNERSYPWLKNPAFLITTRQEKMLVKLTEKKERRNLITRGFSC